MIENIPFIIPFKENSLRCPKKNFYLFPYTVKWLKMSKIRNEDVFVVTESEEVKKFVCQNSKFHILEEQSMYDKNDILAAYFAAKSLKADYYFEVPLTQPFRDLQLISKMNDKINDYDFITSYVRQQKRDIFELNDVLEFKLKTGPRKGSLCHSYNMIDGALYLIKTDFISKILKMYDINSAFWSGNFGVVENKAPFIDIDEISDLQNFNLMKDIIL